MATPSCLRPTLCALHAWVCRASAMRTGLFEMQAQQLRDFKRGLASCSGLSRSCRFVQADHSISYDHDRASHGVTNSTVPSSGLKSVEPALNTTIELARNFLRLANLPNLALDRLSRFEAMLWRQAGRILYALDALDRRKPQERKRRCPVNDWQELPTCEDDNL